MEKEDDRLAVVVLDDSGGAERGTGCTVCWTSPESLQDVLRRIAERFGEKIRIEYVDLVDPATATPYKEIADMIRERSLPLPVLAIDGAPHLAGSFDFRMASEMIEVQLEIRANSPSQPNR